MGEPYRSGWGRATLAVPCNIHHILRVSCLPPPLQRHRPPFCTRVRMETSNNSRSERPVGDDDRDLEALQRRKAKLMFITSVAIRAVQQMTEAVGVR